MLIYIVKTVLIITGINSFLTILLVIADRLFSNYGEYEIDINGKKKITVKGGDSLLSTLNEEKIYLPSACGGRGSCGFCKCKVLEGGGPVLPTEKPFLTSEELQNNVRLACQVKVKNNIKIQIPENIFNIRKFVAKVSTIKDMTYDIKELTLELTEPQKIDFKAGQFIQFEVPKYEKSKQIVTRAYSVSSSPEHKNFIQLIVRKVPEGIATTYIFEHLKEGDTVNFTAPFGEFYIRETDADIFFVAGGSGKAPIKSMVEDLFRKQSKRRMVYFFGARSLKDLYLTEYFREFEKKMQNFTFVPVLSQPAPEDDWKGKTGYIPQYFKEFIKNPQNSEAYLCGSPGMIAAIIKGLKEIGISAEKIYYDKF